MNNTEQQNLNKKKLVAKPVQPSILTSIQLSLKSLKQNLFRFIFITIFFCVSLVFATTTINLYYSDSNIQYAQFQLDYNNKFITLSNSSKLYDYTIKSNFFQIESSNYAKEITDISDGFTIFKSININFPIDKNAPDMLPRYLVKSIDNLIPIDGQADLTSHYSISKITNTVSKTIRCYITDMVAESLIKCNYFNDLTEDDDVDPLEYFVNKSLLLPGCRIGLCIEGIVQTDYQSFMTKNFNDPNVYASYIDNLAFYNSIFVLKNDYVGQTNAQQFISTANIEYTYDDFLYNNFGKVDVIKNIKCKSFDYENDPIILKGHEPQKPPTDQGMQQIAVSKGFFETYFHQSLDEAVFDSDHICGDGTSYIDPSTSTQAVFSFYGYQRIITNFGCRIVGVIDEEEPTIYFCNPEECNDFYNYLKFSYSDYDASYQDLGGKLLIRMSDNLDKNVVLYRTILDRKLTINNLSFVKLQVVNEFINNNLILFLGLFFALCLFSVLMIFNFVVITIKNSTKDIGIYMSLGMNGFKIASIFLFQILLVSIIAFTVSIISSVIFLNLLDYSLSGQASLLILENYGVYIEPIDFEIFRLTKNGFFISFLIAFLTPLLTICIPLLNLSRKKPIDVIKIS